MQEFTAADILASWLVFITTWRPYRAYPGAILLPGYPLLNGYPDARVPVDSPTHGSDYHTLVTLFFIKLK